MTPCLKLVDRLRGIYVMPVNDGLGPLDGKDTFTRDFSKEHNAPQEWLDAADMIEKLQNGEKVRQSEIYRMMAKVLAKKDWLGLGLDPYQAPIGYEAHDELEKYIVEDIYD